MANEDDTWRYWIGVTYRPSNMLTAHVRESKEVVSTAEGGRAILRHAIRLSAQRRLYCPVCDAALYLRVPKQAVAHFCHYPGHECSYAYYEPETLEHVRGKTLLLQHFASLLSELHSVQMEAWLPQTRQIPDIFIRAPLWSLAVEFQCQPISTPEWHQRHALYQQAGIFDFWVLGGSLNSEITALEGIGPHQARLGALERTILEFTGCLVYFVPDGNQLHKLMGATLASEAPSSEGDFLHVAGSIDELMIKDGHACLADEEAIKGKWKDAVTRAEVLLAEQRRRAKARAAQAATIRHQRELIEAVAGRISPRPTEVREPARPLSRQQPADVTGAQKVDLFLEQLRAHQESLGKS